ncbi:MAG: hypothetical protein N2746_03080 [Deltaproteobacteria bacterium]|nr:hypothetical protein [Deltaproteobacteria bacterium]
MFIKFALGIFYILSVVYHKRVNEFVDIFYRKYSFEVTNRFFVWALAIPFLLFVICFIWLSVRKIYKVLSLLSIIILPVIGQYLVLFVSNVEVIHYIQYAIISFIILKISNNLWYSFFSSTVLGVIDEMYQYFVLYVGNPSAYVDYNDMIMNAHGSLIGISIFILLEYRFKGLEFLGAFKNT